MKLKDWSAWIGATLAVVIGTSGLMSYAHSTFVTQREIDIRLATIERKIDAIGKANGLKMEQYNHERKAHK